MVVTARRTGPADAHGLLEPVELERIATVLPPSRVQIFLRRNWQLVLGATISVAGGVIVLLGWYGAAHTTVLQYQIPYLISGGMLGAALIVLGGIYYFAHFLSRQQSRLEQLLVQAIYAGDPELASISELDAEPPGAPTPGAQRVLDEGWAAEQVVWVESGSSFHRPDCQMVRGKTTKRGTEREAERAGLTSCRICNA